MKFWRKLFIRPPRLTGLKPGQAGEEWICYLYRLNGCKVVARNYAVYGRKKLGEIDLVCSQRKRLIMVEVKTRRDENFMSTVEAVDFRKQNFLRRMTEIFIMNNSQYADYDLQIDVAAVLLDPFDNSVRSVKLIENAIEDSQ